MRFFNLEDFAMIFFANNYWHCQCEDSFCCLCVFEKNFLKFYDRIV